MIIKFIFKPLKKLYNLIQYLCGKSHTRRIYVSPSENTYDFTNYDNDISYVYYQTSPILLNTLRNHSFNFSDINNSNENLDCCICLEKINNNKKTIKLNGCHHELHYQCIKNWLINNNECPLCRTNQTKLKKRLKLI